MLRLGRPILGRGLFSRLLAGDRH